MIEAGADINKHAAFLGSAYENSALWMACDQNRPDVVMQLIKAGADVNAVADGSRVSALVAAVVGGHEACVALLINAGAYVSERTFMHNILAQYPCTTNILKMLEDARSR